MLSNQFGYSFSSFPSFNSFGWNCPQLRNPATETHRNWLKVKICFSLRLNKNLRSVYLCVLMLVFVLWENRNALYWTCLIKVLLFSHESTRKASCSHCLLFLFCILNEWKKFSASTTTTSTLKSSTNFEYFLEFIY